MRIAVVQGRADPGRDGVADYVRHLTAALRDLGEEILPVPVLGPREAAERLHALQPDLAHVQFAPSTFGFSARPGLLPNRVRGVPFVTTLHEYGWWASPRWVPGAVWRPLERARLWDRETWRFVPRSTAVLTTNAGHSRVLQERFGRTAVQVPLAPNVPDLGPADRAEARRRLGVPAEAQVVAFFGFVHPVKAPPPRAARCSRRSRTACRHWSPPRTRPTRTSSTARRSWSPPGPGTRWCWSRAWPGCSTTSCSVVRLPPGVRP